MVGKMITWVRVEKVKTFQKIELKKCQTFLYQLDNSSYTLCLVTFNNLEGVTVVKVRL